MNGGGAFSPSSTGGVSASDTVVTPSGSPTSSATFGPSSSSAAAASSPAAKPKKVTIYVTAGCGRCGHRVARWSVRQKVPSSAAPDATSTAPPTLPAGGGDVSVPPSKETGSQPVVAAPPLGVFMGASTYVVPGGAASPAAAAAAPAAAAVCSSSGCSSSCDASCVSGVDHYPEHINEVALFPSHIKCTFLGPEHVLLFPDVKAANYFLTGAVPLAQKAILAAAASGNGSNGGGAESSGGDSSGRKKKSSSAGAADPEKGTIAGGLVCPRCDYLLASSPTKKSLGLKGRVCVYKPSLTLATSTEKPPDPFPAPAVEGTMAPPPAKAKPTHHAALPILRTRKQFWDCLLQSAQTPSPDDVGGEGRGGGGRLGLSSSPGGSPPRGRGGASTPSGGSPTSDKSSSSLASSSDINYMGERYSTHRPAQLVIVMVGQFWCPFSISALVRLSDYKRRQCLASMTTGGAGGAGGHDSSSSVGKLKKKIGAAKGGGGSAAASAEAAVPMITPIKPRPEPEPSADVTTPAATPPPVAPSAAAAAAANSASTPDGLAAPAPTPAAAATPPAPATPPIAAVAAAGPNIAMAPVGGQRVSAGTAAARGRHRSRSSPSSGGGPGGGGGGSRRGSTGVPNGGKDKGAKSNNAHSTAERVSGTIAYVPCTFLLLDSFGSSSSGGSGDAGGGGGVDPAAVLLPDRAADVAALPIPSFLVWYRGCRVFVEGTSQHFRCVKGAVVGLDLARYVDIVVPRIAAEARAAFKQAMRACNASPREVEEAEATASVAGEGGGGEDSNGSGGAGDGGSSDDEDASSSAGTKGMGTTVAPGAVSSSSQGDGGGGKSYQQVWTTVEEVPPYEERPVLHIKL